MNNHQTIIFQSNYYFIIYGTNQSSLYFEQISFLLLIYTFIDISNYYALYKYVGSNDICLSGNLQIHTSVLYKEMILSV